MEWHFNPWSNYHPISPQRRCWEAIIFVVSLAWSKYCLFPHNHSLKFRTVSNGIVGMYHFDKFLELDSSWHILRHIDNVDEYHIILTFDATWHATNCFKMYWNTIYFYFLCLYNISSKLYHPKWDMKAKFWYIYVLFFLLFLTPLSFLFPFQLSAGAIRWNTNMIQN